MRRGGDGFWRRQFSDNTTAKQNTFDVVLGILLPAICYFFDPGIFRPDGYGFSYLEVGGYVFAIYLFSLIAMIALAGCLIPGIRSGPITAVFGGICLVAAVFSFITGILLLPASIIGLLFIIGIFGFTPFPTGLVYLRNGVRAVLRAESYMKRSALAALVITSSIVAIAVPLTTQWEIKQIADRSIGQVIDNPDDRSAIQTAKYLRWAADTEAILRICDSEKDPSRKAKIEAAYKEIMGEVYLRDTPDLGTEK